VVGAVVLLASLGAASSALGYWKAQGAGSGTASTGTTSIVSLSPGAGSADLVPGGTGQVTTVAQNPTATPLHLQSLALDTTRGTGGFGFDSGHTSCGASSLTFATQTNGTTGWTAAANASTTIQLPGSLTLSSTAPSACQGATVTVYLEAVQG
jgi:hypothetical protein